MARSLYASWSLDSLGPAKGLKPMPLGDSADQPGGVGGWWAGLSTMWKALVVFVAVLVIAGISVGIAAAAGAGASDSESDITLRKLTYACPDSAKSPTYSAVLAASGSSYHTVPNWEGTLYVKMKDTGCVTTHTTDPLGYPPLTSNSSSVPSLPSGISGITLSMWEDTTTGYYHLLADGCVTYYNIGNTDNDYMNGDLEAWAILVDGGKKQAKPVCS